MIPSSSCPSTRALFELMPCCLEQFGNPSPQRCVYYDLNFFYEADLAILFILASDLILQSQPPEYQDHSMTAMLPLLQSVVGWPWIWNNPFASVSQTLRLQFMCHCAWLFGLILESGPVSLSSFCPLHIDINIIRAADRGAVVRKSCCCFAPFPIHMPVPRERWEQCFLSLYLACGFTLQQTKLAPWQSQEASCLLSRVSSAQCWLHPHPSDRNSSVPPFQSHIFSPGQERDNTQPHENFGCLWICLTEEMSVAWQCLCLSRYFNKNLN